MIESQARLDDSLEKLSVVIVTWERPEYVADCLRHLADSGDGIGEIVVVDASSTAETERAVAHFQGVQYFHYPAGAGAMTRARNAGLARCQHQVIAFLDDDAMPRPGWAMALLRAYRETAAVAAVGRTVSGAAIEEDADKHTIGRLYQDGSLSANFGADPGERVMVDHGIGANMSFRREVLRQLGGFRTDFGGTGAVREDTDMFLRVRALGLRAIFVPDAVVDHVAAPHARGRRFDWRYNFWARHNHALLLSRNFGLRSRIFLRWMAQEITAVSEAESKGTRSKLVVRHSLRLTGLAYGVLVSVFKAKLGPSDPRRTDRTGATITRTLTPSR
jgi:GT2 family glycosyltransferase